jgi:hypothetical protein
MLALEVLNLMLASPGAVAAVSELWAQRRIARHAGRPRRTELDISIRLSIRRM